MGLRAGARVPDHEHVNVAPNVHAVRADASHPARQHQSHRQLCRKHTMQLQKQERFHVG